MQKSTTRLQITNWSYMRATRRNNDGKATFTTTQLIEGKRENSVAKGFATSRRKNDKDIVPLYIDSLEMPCMTPLSWFSRHR